MGLRTTEATGLVGWIDQRLSIMDAWNNHLGKEEDHYSENEQEYS